MTTLLITLALLLPIPIALWIRPPLKGTGIPAPARALRTRLFIVAFFLAAITLTHRVIFHEFVLPRVDGVEPQGFRPEMLGIWIPWVLLARYATRLGKGTSGGGQLETKRHSARPPSVTQQRIRRAWLLVTLGWLAIAPVIGWAAWQDASWTASLLLLLTPLWLALGFWLPRSGLFHDPEPFPSEHQNPHLTRAYDLQRSLTAWSIFAIFTTSGILHSLLAAAIVQQSLMAAVGSLIAAVITLVAVAIVHRRLRGEITANLAPMSLDQQEQ